MAEMGYQQAKFGIFFFFNLDTVFCYFEHRNIRLLLK